MNHEDCGKQLGHLRDVLIRVHGMATGYHVQSPQERLERIGRLLDAEIDTDPIMRGFLGRGGPAANRDIFSGTGSLDGVADTHTGGHP